MKSAAIQYLKQTVDNFEIEDLVADEQTESETERFCKHDIHWEIKNITKRDETVEITREKKHLGNYTDEPIDNETKIPEVKGTEKRTTKYKVQIRAKAKAILAIKLKHSGANVAAGIAGGASVGAGGGAAAGGGVGALIGGLIGIIGGPPGVAIGAAVGGAIGAATGGITGGLGGGAGGGAIGYNYKFNVKIKAADIFEYLSLEPYEEERGNITTVINVKQEM